MRELHVVDRDELPFSVIARELEGHLHGGVGLCLLFVDAQPGQGPSLHKHDYDEVFIMLDGVGTFTAGDAERELRAGEIAIVPAGMPHKFVNSGDGPLRQIDIHLSPRFGTEWLT